MVSLYTRKAERYSALLDLPEFQDNPTRDLRKRLVNFQELCSNPEFQIAFVGTIKTGKSTLINALLGHNYASMAVTPETAALTKFRSSPKDYVRVTFYSHQEWEKLQNSITSGADTYRQRYQSLNAEAEREKWVGQKPYHKELPNREIDTELRRWTSSREAAHFFVKEVEVGLSSLPADIPPQVVFVDTPGLGDPVTYRSEISRQYIQRANAVFVCVEAKKLQKEEIDTISTVFSFSSHNKNKVYIIGTHWDTLNDPKHDWAEQKEFMKEQLVGKGFYDTAEMAEKNIMHSAALIYNLCRDFDSLSDSEVTPVLKLAVGLGLVQFDFSLSRDTVKRQLGKLKEAANIDTIKRVLVTELADQYRELLRKDIQKQYSELCFNLRRFASEGMEKQNEFIEATAADLAEMQKKVAEQLNARSELDQSRAKLMAALKTVENSTNKRLAAVLDSLDDELKQKAGRKQR